MSNANKLRGTSYGINRDYLREIINTRSKLWADYKTAKDIYPSHKVSISFPAKLIINRKVTRDEFPDWNLVLSSKRTPPQMSVTSANSMSPGPVPLIERSRKDHESTPLPTTSADRSTLSAGNNSDARETTMETTMATEKSDHSDDDDNEVDITTLQNTAGGRPSADHGSPADQYSQVMRNLESLSERGVNYPQPNGQGIRGWCVCVWGGGAGEPTIPMTWTLFLTVVWVIMNFTKPK